MLGLRSKLISFWSLYECYVILISRCDSVWMLLGSFLDQLEKCFWLFFSIDDEGAIEDFMSTVLGVHLRKSEYLRVSQRTSQLLRYIFQIVDFLLAERQTLCLIVGSDILDVLDFFWLQMNVKDLLIQFFIGFLKHGIDLISICHWEKLFDSLDSQNPHVGGDFHCVG